VKDLLSCRIALVSGKPCNFSSAAAAYPCGEIFVFFALRISVVDCAFPIKAITLRSRAISAIPGLLNADCFL